MMFAPLAWLALAAGPPAPEVAGLPPWSPASAAVEQPASAEVPAEVEGAGSEPAAVEPAAEPAAAAAAKPTKPEPASSRPRDTRVVKPWFVGGFIDVNYSYNSNNPDNHVYRGTSVQPRTGEFSLNHAVALIRREAIPDRHSPLFELALQGGPAADALVSYEPNPGGANGKYAGPEVWKHIARANVGFRSRGGTEIVAGLQQSPIGIATHWNPYNWNYSVSWEANAAPYYLSGVKLAHTFRERHQLSLWVVNGWQLLADNNRAPSVLLGYTLTASDTLSFSEHLWVGPEQADMRLKAWRVFSDSQVAYVSDRFGIAAVLDVGGEPRTDLPRSPWQMWMAGAISTRLHVLGEKHTWHMGLRPELFWDRDGRMFGVPQALVSGTYTNVFRVLDFLLLKLEYRYDHSTNPAGFFYRGPAITDDAPGLSRDQHTIFFSVAGVLAHRFAGKRG